jgi:aryl-alcohol dehydrogenase-like predicted oxidoreductase
MGGGGIGQVWGETDRLEAVATLREAVDEGITLIDVAPSYGTGEAERVVGEAFDGALPENVRVLTKHHVGHARPTEVEDAMLSGLDESLQRMRLSFVDVFLLHSQLIPAADPERHDWTTPVSLFREAARPALEALVDQGRIGAWGITAAQFPAVLGAVFVETPAPQVTQMVANALDAPGDMSWSESEVGPRSLIKQAKDLGIGVIGIRALAAGALTDRFDRDLPRDHPAMADYQRAATFRLMARESGESPASLAYRYALSIPGVDTVSLGVKNRIELRESLQAAQRGPLTDDLTTSIEAQIRSSSAGSREPGLASDD